MKTRFYYNGTREVTELARVPKISSFNGLNSEGPDLCGCISSAIAGGSYGLLPGFYPVVGPAGSGKTTFLFGHNVDSDSGLFGAIDNCISDSNQSGRINVHVWQIGEPEYVPAGDAETTIRALVYDLATTHDSIFLVDSLRDLTVLSVSGLASMNSYLAQIDGTAIANSGNLHDTVVAMQEAAQHLPTDVHFSSSNAIGKGGLPASYVSMLSFINSLCQARDNVCLAVLNPLFITEESYITTIDAVTQGALRIGSTSSSLLRLYEYQTQSIKRVPVRIQRAGTSSSYEVGPVVHVYDEPERPSIPTGVLGAYYSGVFGFPEGSADTGTESSSGPTDGAGEE